MPNENVKSFKGKDKITKIPFSKGSIRSVKNIYLFPVYTSPEGKVLSLLQVKPQKLNLYQHNAALLTVFQKKF